MRKVASFLLRPFKYLYHVFLSAGAKLHPHPIFVLGNQKSGTTAIAALLGRAAGLSLTIDLQRENRKPTYHLPGQNELALEKFIENNRLAFSREIVKEPNLTFLFPRLIKRFPESRFVFIVRDPRDNIRSMLDRQCFPGDLSELDAGRIDNLPPVWKQIHDGTWPNCKEGNYVEKLAFRWNLAAELFLEHRTESILVLYEDFLNDKVGCIGRILGMLGEKPVKDILNVVDVPFQPRGKRDVSWLEFFGGENLATIERICGESMTKLGYLPGAERPQSIVSGGISIETCGNLDDC
jgi:Sulfotransferase family